MGFSQASLVRSLRVQKGVPGQWSGSKLGTVMDH